MAAASVDVPFRIPLGVWVKDVVDFITDGFGGLFDVIRVIFGGLYELLDFILTAPPFWAVILVAVVLAFLARGWRMAAGTAVGFLLIAGVAQWENAMDTLALVLVASVIAVVLSVPLGILAARSKLASTIIKPVLDFMQTMPAFVYLIPALILFRVGVVPGIVATIIFALAPGVRLTELGIRGVDSEVVEAGQAFGASPFRILRQIQLPLALPSIMAGVNQVIMLSLSMVVIAGMVGAGGLGGDVVASLNRIDIRLGAEAGISVVIIAVFLDRMTAALGQKRRKRPRVAQTSRASTAESTGSDAAAGTSAVGKSAAMSPAKAAFDGGTSESGSGTNAGAGEGRRGQEAAAR
ncbi:proline/glycine betaine ABC transporter permease [Paeniglutamicibacter antarcticus]|uniref:Proline/glycine betaine ABC transporter permease n=2 Tax=Arthrobacter terrae TaxID=2935737 RepID=A0A931CM34_9MICC|nr:proline/glycine betaine ABC transporter permease [Arthrobacter terrae]MBG0737959.1 proline/glycine betaine ABC transporter permease [Arthrobacter terrae]